MCEIPTFSYPHLCFSRGREGSTQQASVSGLLLGMEERGRVGGEDRRIFCVQLFCLRWCCCCGGGWAGGCCGCLVRVGWGVSSLFCRSGLSNCAGGRRETIEDVTSCKETSWFELGAGASSKYRIWIQQFDDSCKMLLSMLRVYAEYAILMLKQVWDVVFLNK